MRNKTQSVSASPPSGSRYRQGTALIVNPEPLQREALKRFFAAADYHVLTSSTSDEAIELCRKDGNIHVLVTDLEADEASGWTLAESAAKVRPGLMVLFVSAGTLEQASPASIQQNAASSTSPKAFTPGMLSGVMQALCRGSQVEKRLN